MRRTLPLIACLLLVPPAMAQQDSPEARLRELLRRTGAELRAAQDGLAATQVSLEQEKQKNAALQKQIDELNARPPEKPSISDEDLAALNADLAAQKTRAAELDKALKQWTAAYQKAADTARAKDAESKAAIVRATESERRANVCIDGNTKLIGVANNILHMYESRSFRSLLLASHEPLLGLKKVELQNTIQDYEDKLLDRKYIPGQPPR